MSRAAKHLAAMRQNAKDWRIEDLEAVAAQQGLKVRKSGGSHVVFSHPASRTALSVPAKRPIKPVYIRKFIELIDEISESP